MSVQKKWAAILVAVPAALLSAVATVFACTSLPTLNISPTVGTPGSTTTVIGSAFSTAPGSGPVLFHLDSASGLVIGTALPLAGGVINPTTLTIPADVQPGTHVIVATQSGADGKPVAATPVRGVFDVVAVAPGQQPVTAGSTSGPGLNVGLVLMIAVLGIAGLGLLGAGVVSSAASSRRPTTRRARGRR